MKWRWDQGHSAYLLVDNIRTIARAFVQLEGVEVGKETLDAPLREATGLGFRCPPTHWIWRQYKRTFECGMLASAINRRLVATDICRRLVNDEYGADEYMYDFLPRFVFPFPAFTEQDPEEQKVYPFCAIGKLLLSAVGLGRHGISLADIFSQLVGNRVSGTEPLDSYASLPRTSYRPGDAEWRQVREMLIFSSQLSFLKWTGDELVLDISSGSLSDTQDLLNLFTPIPELDGTEPLFYRITQLTTEMPSPFNAMPASPDDDTFLEGGKSRMTHLRIERSPLVRRLYRGANEDPLCEACERDMHVVYPWTEYMLEIHHLLPLSSPLLVDKHGTSLKDIAGLCPNCHRSVHSFYNGWLREHGQQDFNSKQEALEVYNTVKTRIRP